jgi:ATP-dependent Clp protease ATP-binding subunit ClpC
VGKTYLAECLSRAIYGEESNDLLRLNMNEYKESYDLTRLTGAAPGFIGHDRQGVLFRFVEGHPQGVILLDEIDKAHPEIQDYFLQIFDKAESVDSRGRKADFRQYIFILTCNIATNSRQAGGMGFKTGDEKGEHLRGDAIRAQLKQHFRPEFLARIDQLIDFKALDSQDYGILLNRLLEAMRQHFRQKKNIDLVVDEQTTEGLLQKISSHSEGVRGLIHRFQQVVEAPLLHFIQANPHKDRIELTWKDDGLLFG